MEDGSRSYLDRLMYLERQERVSQMCRLYKLPINYRINDTALLEHILVDHRNKLLYCYVPKVACTNWKRVFMVLSGYAKPAEASRIPADLVHKPSTLYRLSNYSADVASEMLGTYTKFLFVRHPFERLLSAYRNKLEQRHESSRYFQSRFGRRIVKRYRVNASERSLLNGDDVTFPEFASFVADTRDHVFNEHWASIDKLCKPCAVNYDFIGKHESLFSDSDYFLKHVVGAIDVKFPRGPDTNTSTQLKKYYNSLDHNAIVKLYNTFELDFKFFDYNLQNIIGYEVG
ncbi:carbohydrate sulfotransferase 11 isoform X2 [Daktulosphaira vitifoliae]|nr:carbohydrate sulfotransferase 11 isoform X2 [Daktulosphaira vitifoliae]XP_050527660.1 carbohydrate sulfotransferase 11 isoform X2 [Daktulosphaira vitifoliae]XP_050527662.1 carbohydrate sulfotransferase 11 isoform X2 [Daktulosphaira vitifoliae]XP_050527663.1 carbohydrate sulfotransferase 11 isoform X2 [Daktulosphaira vitifoliae]